MTLRRRRDSVRDTIVRLFSTSPEAMTETRRLAGEYLTAFLSRPGVTASHERTLLPQDPSNGKEVPPSAYFDYVLNTVISNSTNMASPRCLGHMTSVTPAFLWPLSELVVALNQNLVKWDASSLLTPLERQVLAMMHEQVYRRSRKFYDDHTHEIGSTLGIMTSGGTLSNLCSLWLARNTKLGPSPGFAGIETEGLSAALVNYDCGRVVILASQLAHYSIHKAASILGLGERNLIAIPVDVEGRMRPDCLRNQVTECREKNWKVLAVVSTAGTTDSGSIDDLTEIGTIAREAGAHFHVDAASAFPLLFSPRYRKLLAGIDMADTVTADTHKQMYLPLGSSVLLLRDPCAAAVIEKHSRYMLQPGSGDLGNCSVEGSRPGNGLLLHAALHVIGKEGYAWLVEENIRKARLMALAIDRKSEFALLMRPHTNVLLYRYIPRHLRRILLHGSLTAQENACINEWNLRLQSIQRNEGRTFVSRTTIELPGKMPAVALRAVISNPLITEADFEEVLQDQIEIAETLERAEECEALACSRAS
jgi:glutamate decarboxylase